jgi:hypothetical protein
LVDPGRVLPPITVKVAHIGVHRLSSASRSPQCPLLGKLINTSRLWRRGRVFRHNISVSRWFFDRRLFWWVLRRRGFLV